ncbi:tetratricopeptide repeat protein [Kiritimatiellaeota bacterium B1221]|nr:tetratricopeptide repeat protein [Kiritimatiellaeota bacterium B1221]
MRKSSNILTNGSIFADGVLSLQGMWYVNFLLMVLGVFCAPLKADELPKSLRAAIAQVQTEDAEKSLGVLRRFAYTDKVDERLAARTALAELDRNAGRLDRAATWVADYQNPQPENFAWPRIQAYVEAAKIQFMQGKAFESVKRLTDAKDKTSGLAKIEVERALSWVVEQKPELKQALEYEKSALITGESYFKRKKISETAGLEPAKPGAELWKELKPEIKTRISELERKVRIDSYGLDFVLYSEAQEFRKAAHPLAMDFTNVAAAFDRKGDIGGRVPGADYEMAVERYNEILEFFPDNPYGQAAKLYLAVITAKTGDPDGAIKQLKAFYKEDPDGLMRGEALKLMGDLYLFAKWDKANAREAYERAIRWTDAVEERQRVLDTYLVPEKSKEVSRPPKKYKELTKEGLIQEVPVPFSALVNRTTSGWYLDRVRASLVWRLGFLFAVDDKWDEALERYKEVMKYDPVLQDAVTQKYRNAFARVEAGFNSKSIIASREQMAGLHGKMRTLMMWADFRYVLADFDVAQSLYQSITRAAKKKGDVTVYCRAVLGSMLVKNQATGLDQVKDVEIMHDIIVRHPTNPSAPVMLELCAVNTLGAPLDEAGYFKWLYEKYPKSEYAIRARYFEILRVPDLKELDRRKKMISAFKKDFPDELSRHESLDFLMGWWTEQCREQIEIEARLEKSREK